MGNPLGMSFSLKKNPNEIPSVITQQKQIKRINQYVEKVEQQIKSEIDICIQDQLNLVQGL